MKPAAPAPSWTGRDWLALASLLVVGTVVYGWIAVNGTTVTSFSDSIDYLFLSDFYRDVHAGAVADDVRSAYRLSRFPPVFPLVLSLFDAGSANIHRAYMVSCATAVLGALATWWWVRATWGRGLATAVGLALLLYPGYFLLNLSPVSEPLAMALLFSALALLAMPTPTSNRLLTAALIIALSLLVRTALLPLAVGFALWLWTRRPARWPLLATSTVLAFLPLAIWTVYRKLLGADAYANRLSFDKLLAGWGGWPDAVWLQPLRLYEQFLYNWGVPPNLALQLASAVFLVLAAAGAILRLRENQLDAWFVAGYIAMILVWPYPDYFWRFLIVVYPILLAYAVLASARIAQAWPGAIPRQPSPRLAAVFFVALAFASLPAATRYLHRAMLPVDAIMLGEKRDKGFFRADNDAEALVNAELYARNRLASQAAGEIAGDRCVYSIFVESLQLHGHVRAVPYPAALDPKASAEPVLTRCDFYFVSGFNSLDRHAPALFPHQALADWTEPVLVSRMILPDGRTITAAALARRKR